MTDQNPDLQKAVEKTSEVKSWLVNYIGEQLQPENEEVTVEMAITVLAKEFPELLLSVAEENFIRGYQQALVDVDTFEETAKTSVKAAK
jgi:hypothetical protein